MSWFFVFLMLMSWDLCIWCYFFAFKKSAIFFQLKSLQCSQHILFLFSHFYWFFENFIQCIFSLSQPHSSQIHPSFSTQFSVLFLSLTYQVQFMPSIYPRMYGFHWRAVHPPWDSPLKKTDSVFQQLFIAYGSLARSRTLSPLLLSLA